MALLESEKAEQPPSGGCVLKPMMSYSRVARYLQPPSGGCVLKLYSFNLIQYCKLQPPSGGCVLKHYLSPFHIFTTQAAAFGRLCVETEV